MAYLKHTFFGLLFLFLLTGSLSYAQSTPNYYKCQNRVGGEWNYGRAPQVCDARTFGDDQIVFEDYSPVIFNDFENISQERSRYMNELNAIIKAASIYYLKKRNPKVSQSELDWWSLGILTTASQESYWSHYRMATDKRLKMMRGDYGHGHGMMQIDDRAHFNAIERGIGWNLAAQLTYGMDIYYAAWIRAPQQSCVGSSTNYIARVRAAWSAYNGGPSRICRWQNPNDKWSRNDKNFYSQLTNKKWQTYVKDNNQVPSINIECLMEKGSNCSSVPTPTPPPQQEPFEWSENQLYIVENQKACLYSSSILHCVEDQKDRICLLSINNFDQKRTVAISEKKFQEAGALIWNRHELCKKFESTLYSVGQSIQIQKDINLRKSVGAGVLLTIPEKTILTVLDFEIQNSLTRDRYYKVQYKSKTGYIYAGQSSNFLDWVTDSSDLSDTPSLVAQVNQKIKIVINSGINLRANANGKILTAIPKNSILTVEKIQTEGVDNKIFYQVRYQGRLGYIYSGKLNPQNTVSSWTVVIN